MKVDHAAIANEATKVLHNDVMEDTKSAVDIAIHIATLKERCDNPIEIVELVKQYLIEPSPDKTFWRLDGPRILKDLGETHSIPKCLDEIGKFFVAGNFLLEYKKRYPNTDEHIENYLK